MSRARFSGVLVVVTFIVFGRGLTYPMLTGWDDGQYVLDAANRITPALDNVVYWFTHYHAHNYHPLTMLSYMVDYSVWGTNPVGYHLQNLLWHVAAGTALYSIFLRLKIEPFVAACLVLVFAVHPQRVESVVWISERKDVMCAALYLFAFERYLTACTTDKARFILPFAIWVAALLSKAMAITLPAILVLYELHRGTRPADIARRCWPYCLLALIMVPVTIVGQGTAIATEFAWERPCGVVLHNLIWYIESFVVPANLAPLYPRIEITTALVTKIIIVACVLIAGYAYLAHRSRAVLTFVIVPLALAYLCIGAPVLGAFSLGAIDYADRYSYLMSAVLLLAIGTAITAIQRSTANSNKTSQLLTRLQSPRVRKAVTALCLVYVVVLAFTAFIYVPTFRSDYELWVTATTRERANPFAIGALAEYELMNKDYDLVLRLAETLESRRDNSLTRAHIRANALKAQYLRASVALRRGQFIQAEASFRQLLRHIDNASTAPLFRANYVRDKLAECYRELNQFTLAIPLYNKILESEPPADAFLNRGVCYFNTGGLEAAITDFHSALEIDPDHTQAAALLAIAIERLDEVQQDR